jgi:hypothetical protein
MAVPIHTRAEVSRAAIDAALAGGDPTVLAATDWLEGVRGKELDALYRTFEDRYADALPSATALLGEPDLDLEAVQAFAPEALSAAGWTRGERVLVLGVLHHDQETPVVLQLWSLTRDEITALNE